LAVKVNQLALVAPSNSRVSIVPIRRRAPRLAILGVKEYVKTAPDMAVYGAVEFARNLHATVNSSSEMRRKH
jgi:hypothetical protein